MNVGYKVKSKKLYDRGNEALSYRIEIPQIDGIEEINSFYDTVAQECEKYCNDVLFDSVCKARRENRRARYSYRFFARVTHLADGLMSVVLFACLREKNEIVSQYAWAHTWELENACLLPPSIVCKRVCGAEHGKKRKRAEIEGAFLSGGKMFNIKNVDIEDILSKSRVKYAVDLQ